MVILCLPHLQAAVDEPAESADGSPLCAACGKALTEKIVDCYGKTYCNRRCARRDRPACSVCGKRKRNLEAVDMDFFCGQCRDLAGRFRCTSCRKVMPEKHLVSGGKVFCSTGCYLLSLPPCAICGKPTRFRIVVEDTVFCERCAALEPCFSCGRPGKTNLLMDGRRICSSCRQSAVFELGRARDIFNEVRLTMDRELEIGTDHQIELELVDTRQLMEIRPGTGIGLEMGHYHYEEETTTTYTFTRDRQGQTKNRKKLNELTKKYFRVYILHNLPLNRFIEVAAHELAHDWLRENFPLIEEPWMVEGFAEHVASRVNRLYGHEELNERMENSPHPVYGEGFRRMERLAATCRSMTGLLEYLSRQGSDTPGTPTTAGR